MNRMGRRKKSSDCAERVTSGLSPAAAHTSLAADIQPDLQAGAVRRDVVLIHGLAASRCDWVWLGPELAQAGFRAIAPDLPGHGDSIKPDEPDFYTIQRLYAAFEDWLDELALSTPMVLIGHSLGGNLCLRYARRHPERLAGLVLIDPFYSSSQLSPLMRALFRRPHLAVSGMRRAPAWLVNALIGLDPLTVNKFPSSVRQQISHDYLRASPHIMHLPPSGGELLHALHEVCLKTLVVWGERDLTLQPASFPLLVERMPCAEGRSVPKCGHQPHLTRPDIFNPWVLEFLESLEPGGKAGTP
jgi:4,5:9,10-diseco-3-hydroxy-5,9,17-trioxoandrosta-1(10),2-diene-4-oate hydrolase